ncbi:MAG TPA: crosslink repair DNA glycosylase YcaQ family protein [Symbiobacteriaceae bacterium]|nr:crosslink repair DNA glycosylase YcaQ family protein [Symbiobacteriaceae bacterium]
MPLTLEDIRRQAVVRNLLPAPSLAEAIARLGFVQADPLCAPARAQDLILRHRVTGYRFGDLERQYPVLEVDEDYLHLYGFMPSRVRALLYPRVRDWRIENEFPGLGDKVAAYIRENGPTDHRGLEAHFGAVKTMGSWGTQAKATTKVLEMLHYSGLLRVVSRRGPVRVYAAADLQPVDLDPPAKLREMVLLLAGLYAPAPLGTLKMVVRWFLRTGALGLLGKESAVAEMLSAGELEQAKVDGVIYVWPTGGWAEGEAPPAVRLLAPFDPLVWDRDRFEQLWGWPYRLEAYTPAAKRQYGHYALPLLWGDRVIGWANVGYAKGEVAAELGYVEGRPTDAAFGRELEAELERMRTFMGGGKT